MLRNKTIPSQQNLEYYTVTKPTFELQIFHVITTCLQSSEADSGGVLLKKVFLKIS